MIPMYPNHMISPCKFNLLTTVDNNEHLYIMSIILLQSAVVAEYVIVMIS